MVFDINDLLRFTDKSARLKQVKKKTTENIVVVRVRNELVFVPSIDSRPEKLSKSPPPLPLWTSTSTIKQIHANT